MGLVRRIQWWLSRYPAPLPKSELRCPSCQMVVPPPVQEFCPLCGASLEDDGIEASTKALIVRTVVSQLHQSTSDRDLIIREISLDALQRTANHVKLYLLIFGLVLSPLIVIGVTDLRTFFSKIQPQLAHAQAALAATQSSLERQGAQLAGNKRSLAALEANLVTEKSESVILSARVKSAASEIAGVSSSIQDLRRQTTEIRQKYVESDLEQDFASLVPGAEHVLIDGRVFSNVEGTPSFNPVVYLTASSGLSGHLTLGEVRLFNQEMKVLNFPFIHGSIAVQKGGQSFGVSIVPYSSCTQVIYFNKKFASQAAAVGEVISKVFDIKVPAPFFVDYTKSSFWDDSANYAIRTIGVGIAAAAVDPFYPICPNGLAAEQRNPN